MHTSFLVFKTILLLVLCQYNVQNTIIVKHAQLKQPLVPFLQTIHAPLYAVVQQELSTTYNIIIAVGQQFVKSLPAISLGEMERRRWVNWYSQRVKMPWPCLSFKYQWTQRTVVLPCRASMQFSRLIYQLEAGQLALSQQNDHRCTWDINSCVQLGARVLTPNVQHLQCVCLVFIVLMLFWKVQS